MTTYAEETKNCAKCGKPITAYRYCDECRLPFGVSREVMYKKDNRIRKQKLSGISAIDIPHQTMINIINDPQDLWDENVYLPWREIKAILMQGNFTPGTTLRIANTKYRVVGEGALSNRKRGRCQRLEVLA